MLTSPSPDCTPKAVTHRIAKLRALAAETLDATAASNGDAATPTPKKRAAPNKKNTSTTPAKPKTSAGKTGAATTGQKRTAGGKAKVNGAEGKGEAHSEGEDDDVEDGEEDLETPSKVRR